MTTIPEVLLNARVPLKGNTSSDQAIEMANEFYETELDSSLFKKTQAYTNANGQLQIDLLDVTTRELVTSFYGKASSAVKPAAAQLNITPAVSEYMAPVLFLHSAEEIAFLDALVDGEAYPDYGTNNELSFALSTLLNLYGVLGGWVSGTLGEYVTGGFRRVYKGSSEFIPEGFSVGQTSMVAIVEIVNGQHKGFICMRT